MIEVSYKYAKLIRNGFELYASEVLKFSFDEDLRGSETVFLEGSNGSTLRYDHQGGAY